jgi:hypothetical protein
VTEIEKPPGDDESPREPEDTTQADRDALSPFPAQGSDRADPGPEERQPAEPSKQKTDLLAYAKNALRLARAGGILIAVGYTAEAGHDELLGVNFPINRTVTDYSLAGGRFFVDVIIKSWMHPWISLAGLIAIAASITLVAAIRHRWPERPRIIDAFALLWIVAIPIWKGYRLDFPYIQLEGILKRMPLDESPPTQSPPSWQRFKEAELRDKFVCSHIQGQRDEISRALDKRFPQCFAIVMRTETISSDTVQDLLVPSAPHYSFSIEQEFIISVFVAAYALAMIFATAPSPQTSAVQVSAQPSGPQSPDTTHASALPAVLRGLSVVLTVASLVTLPYVYGKVIQGTESPAGRVAFDSVDAMSTPPMQPTIAFAYGLLIWTDDKFVTIYRSDTFEFLHLGRNRVRYISVDRTKDIIRIYAKAYCPAAHALGRISKDQQPVTNANKRRTQ